MKYNTRLTLSSLLLCSSVAAGTSDLKKNLINSAKSNIPFSGIENPQESKRSTIYSKRRVINGIVEIKTLTHNLPPICFFYEGAQAMSNSLGLFSLPMDKQKAELSLLICRSFDKVLDDNGEIISLKIDGQKNYRYYIQEKSPNDTEHQWIAGILPETGVIPKDTIIMVMEPDYVVGIEPWHEETSGKSILLPKITLKEDPAMQRVMLECLAHVPDLALWHEKVTRTEKVSPVSLHQV